MKMNKLSVNFMSVLLVIIFCIGIFSCAKKQKLDLNAKDLYQKMVTNPNFEKTPNGESFCWQAANGMDQFVNAYNSTKDTCWLNYGIKYYDFLIDKMDTTPDGYKGWIGTYGYDNNYWCDVHVGDAIILKGVLEFASLVMKNESLKKIYEDKAVNYAEIAKKHFVEKWDKRGTWEEVGPYGAYVSDYRYLEPGNLNKWVEKKDVKNSRLTLPFNKQNEAALVNLLIYSITGEKFYWDKAEKIFFNMKSRFQYFDNHYVWNYWEPFGLWDIDLGKKTTQHWVGVHPWRSGYTAMEVDQVAEAYHYGLVFDEQDIQRIINTNLEVMWNKDRVKPAFINSNGLGADKDTTGLGAFQRAWGHSSVAKNQGQLWTGLLDFSQTVRDLYELRFKKDNPMSIGRLYYNNVILKEPPGFKRKYIEDPVTVPTFNFTECKDLIMATVIPHIIIKGKKSVIISKSWKEGELEISLYSKDKKEKILFKGSTIGSTDIESGVFFITWDGTDPDKKVKYSGDYTIRWTSGDGYREFPITIN
jgi:hypothetical protein